MIIDQGQWPRSRIKGQESRSRVKVKGKGSRSRIKVKNQGSRVKGPRVKVMDQEIRSRIRG